MGAPIRLDIQDDFWTRLIRNGGGTLRFLFGVSDRIECLAATCYGTDDIHETKEARHAAVKALEVSLANITSTIIKNNGWSPISLTRDQVTLIIGEWVKADGWDTYYRGVTADFIMSNFKIHVPRSCAPKDDTCP